MFVVSGGDTSDMLILLKGDNDVYNRKVEQITVNSTFGVSKKY